MSLPSSETTAEASANGKLRHRARALARPALLALIVGVALVRVGRTWSVFSATADEPQHIEAGVEWLARADRVQHEPWRTVNPPLARIAVALGPYIAGLRAPQPLGGVVYAGPGYARVLALARAGVLPFLALAIVLTWALARRAYGEPAAWVAALLLASVPAVLGHAGLATTDVAFSAAYVLALIAILRWIEAPARGRAAAAGLALGLAAATKFSAVTLLPVAVLAAIARRVLAPRPGTTRRLLAQAPLVAAVALLVVWGAYRFSVGVPAALWQRPWLEDTVNACFPSERGRRAAEWLLARRLPAPAAFLAAVGLCAQEAPGRSTAFLLGRLTQDGFPAFFPVALAVKSPLPLLALAACGLWAILRGTGSAEQRFRALSPVIAAAVLMATAMPARTNIGVRHILPIFPLLAAFAGSGAVALWQARRRRGPARAAAAALIVWALVIPFTAAPDYFPWFNALAGRHPERVLVDSDLDWGQDLLRLQRALAARRAESVSLAYFGSSAVCRHGLPRPRWLRAYERARGWVAVSEMYRSGVAGSYYRDGDPCDQGQFEGVFTPDPKAYAWLDAYEPVARIGASIALYHIP